MHYTSRASSKWSASVALTLLLPLLGAYGRPDGKRETFAYACEAFSCISEMASSPADRKALLARLQDKPPPPDDRVDPKEYLEILGEAVERRNGWRAILERCSRRPRARSVGSAKPLERQPLEKEEVQLDIRWATGKRFEGG